MTDLTAWLRTQLDEDERIALEVIGGLGDPEAKPVSLSGTGQLIVGDRAIPAATTSHMLRWSPNHVLAEVEARRRILDLHDLVQERAIPAEAWVVMNRVVEALALPYADRDGYLEQWRP